MAIRRKCSLCGKPITDETEAVNYKGSFVHSDCFAASLKTLQDDRMKQAQSKKQQAKKAATKPTTVKIPKRGLTEEEHKEKVQFFEYIRQQLNVEKLPPKVFAVADKTLERYIDMTYPGMFNTLRYCVECKDMKLTDDCVGLIPYYYQEANAYYRDYEIRQQNVAETVQLLNTKNVEVVKINLHNRRNDKLININEIGVDDMGKTNCTQT